MSKHMVGVGVAQSLLRARSVLVVLGVRSIVHALSLGLEWKSLVGDLLRRT